MSPVGVGLARDSGGSVSDALTDQASSLASQLPQGLRCFQFGSVGALVIARLAANVYATVITDLASAMYATVITDFTSAMHAMVITDFTGPMHTVVVAGFRMRAAAAR